jgi:hypothetical protein
MSGRHAEVDAFGGLADGFAPEDDAGATAEWYLIVRYANPKCTQLNPVVAWEAHRMWGIFNLMCGTDSSACLVQGGHRWQRRR